MLFNSYEFLFAFLPTALLVYFLLHWLFRKFPDVAKTWLVGASLFFYSWWEPAYLPVILASLFFNFFFGRFISNKGKTKFWLITGIAANVVLLGYFKYAGFLMENFSLLAGMEYTREKIELPLAISFFTFQQIAFLVDSYQSKVKERNFLNYGMFVTFFPQLIAGPIVHHSEMMPQFSDAKNFRLRSANVSSGIMLFSVGLSKKVMIADMLSLWVKAGFDDAASLGFAEAWIVSLAYTFQLYFDFSGYTDMAIGIGKTFNIRLPFNFNSPYRATDIQDFWRRWHITLSRFLRNYIYVPLGGNRGSSFFTMRNLMLTFIIGGIWHGAGWTFIFWGFLHGSAIVIHRLWTKAGKHMFHPLAWLITFLFVNVAWVFFRAETWADAIKVLKGMVGMTKSVESPVMETVSQWQFEWILIGLLAFVIFVPNTNRFRDDWSPNIIYLLIAVALVSVCLVNLNKISEFIYFGF